MKRLLIFSLLALSFGCSKAPTQRQEIPPAGFKQVTVIDENGAHTVTMPSTPVPMQPVLPVAPAAQAPKTTPVIGESGYR